MINELQDTYRHKGMRYELVELLKQKGIKSQAVLDAIRQVPRHYFFDSAFLEHAYQDKAFGIGEGQTISQPSTVAFQTELLEIEPNMRVLEIGTGSGYQACVLMEMGAKVTTIEYNRVLYEQSRLLLKKIGYKKATLLWGDGSEGYPLFAPYDRILVTAGAPKVPFALIEQLRVGGVLVIPVGNREKQEMMKIRKLNAENKLDIEAFEDFRFVPLLGKYGWDKGGKNTEENPLRR